MLDLRLAQPSMLVDVSRLAELRQVIDDGDALWVGAGITHAQIEDGMVPDPTGGLMRSVAAGIAYRAVRNRGTLGGSLAHADPAADWVSTVRLLDAQIGVQSGASSRRVDARDFFIGPFETALAEDELITGVRFTRLSGQARWGYWKFCRKPGEFADALAGVLVEPERGIERAVIGAHGGVPTLIEGPGLLARLRLEGGASAAVRDAGIGEDDAHRGLLAVALGRALAQCLSPRSADDPRPGPRESE
jgi:carbon-monoxide dehydrogenase medium subunit